ncbi:MAG: hypothetical protein P8011_01170 [Acidihalobacter sp.]|uniref:hypothetical protein n=1 Tax=Acidihalobacter sp. TaxID=1872108 RepID=UPI00307D0183
MSRRPTPRASISAQELEKRLRNLGEAEDLSPDARRRLKEILKDIRPSGLSGTEAERLEKPGGVNVSVLKAGELTTLVSAITSRSDLPTVDTLDFVTTAVMKSIREHLPETLPLHPLPIGDKGVDLPVASSALTRLLRLAAVARSDAQNSVVWDDGVNQIIVHVDRIKAAVTKGQIRIDIPVVADRLKAVMQVPFAVGSEDRLAGLVAATVLRPAGNAVVAHVWGDALIALAYGALMDAVVSMAGASGRDVENERLVPRALIAQRGQLTIESQARFRFKGQIR